MNEIKQLVDELNQAFSEHKVKNDQRLKNLEKNGRVDPLLEQQVNRIASEIQELTDVKQGLERVQTQLNRPGFEFGREGFDPLAEKKKAAVEKYLRKGEASMSPDEIKFLSSQQDADGGYWVTSSMSDKVVSKVFETSPMRNVATVETISSDALEIPNDLSEANAAWTTEEGARAETDTPTIGIVTIPVHELYAMPKATQTLLDDSRIDVENWLAGNGLTGRRPSMNGFAVRGK
jgi:HK97 family phage major capsid protein